MKSLLCILFFLSATIAACGSAKDTPPVFTQDAPAAATDNPQQGPKGDTGAQGQAGAKGDTGASGSAGAKGEAGTQGATGAQGPKGDTGAQGIQGDAGAAGQNGTNGMAGAPGAGNYFTDPDTGIVWTYVAGNAIHTNAVCPTGFVLPSSSATGVPAKFLAYFTEFEATIPSNAWFWTNGGNMVVTLVAVGQPYTAQPETGANAKHAIVCYAP